MQLTEQIARAVSKRATMLSSTSDPQGGNRAGIDIGFGTDSAYVRPMGVTIVSLAVNNPGMVLRCHVFASSITDADVAFLAALVEEHPHVEVHLYDVDSKVFSGLPTLEKYPLPIYFRLMMPITLSQAPRVLYLDSDILCMGDIQPLLDLALDENVAAVVSDVGRTAKKRITALELTGDRYFNSGVMLINVPKWNELHITERTLEMLSATPERFLLPDQDVLNILLQDKAIFLPQAWNCMSLAEDALKEVTLLHCAAHPKPWRIACHSKAQPLYLKFEGMSPWRGQPLEQPVDYKEARWYARGLLMRWRIVAGLGWYARAGVMKFQKKILGRAR